MVVSFVPVKYPQSLESLGTAPGRTGVWTRNRADVGLESRRQRAKETQKRQD